MMRREYVHTTHVKTNHWAAGMRRVEGALALFVFSLSLSLSLPLAGGIAGAAAGGY